MARVKLLERVKPLQYFDEQVPPCLYRRWCPTIQAHGLQFLSNIYLILARILATTDLSSRSDYYDAVNIPSFMRHGFALAGRVTERPTSWSHCMNYRAEIWNKLYAGMQLATRHAVLRHPRRGVELTRF